MGFPSNFSRIQLANLLHETYPHFKWEKVYLLRGKKAQQKRLENAVAELFPVRIKEFVTPFTHPLMHQGYKCKANARKEANLVNPKTGVYLEVDLWFPQLSLAFEYQEAYHYTSMDYTDQPLDTYQARDRMKMELAASRGITLIIVPFWWDGRQER